MHKRRVFIFTCIVLISRVCSSQPLALDRAIRIDRILIAGQPSEEEIRSLPQRGISCVVNVRTPEEMNDKNQVSFDESSLLKELDIKYFILPIGSEKYPYRTEVLESFAGIIQTCKDTILLHCKIGARAQWLYAAYEIKYLGRSPEDVIKSFERFGFWPLPLEKLSGIPLRLEKKE